MPRWVVIGIALFVAAFFLGWLSGRSGQDVALFLFFFLEDALHGRGLWSAPTGWLDTLLQLCQWAVVALAVWGAKLLYDKINKG
jgi:hypothetical protein